VGRTLAECNGLAAEAAGRELAAGNAAPRFAREVAAGRPHPSAAALADTARDGGRRTGVDEVAVASAAHPRMGERAAGGSVEASSSRRERSAASAERLVAG
jgi:2-oxo-4-hydroxy-4-carboxy-5-ureidoimidazoline decarboxylase